MHFHAFHNLHQTHGSIDVALLPEVVRCAAQRQDGFAPTDTRELRHDRRAVTACQTHEHLQTSAGRWITWYIFISGTKGVLAFPLPKPASPKGRSEDADGRNFILIRSGTVGIHKCILQASSLVSLCRRARRCSFAKIWVAGGLPIYRSAQQEGYSQGVTCVIQEQQR